MLLLPFQPQPGAPPVAESANMDAFGVTGNFYEVLQNAHRQQSQIANPSAPPSGGAHPPSLASLMATILNDTRIRLQSPAQPPASAKGDLDFVGEFTRDIFSETQETDIPALNLLDTPSETGQLGENQRPIAHQVQNAPTKSNATPPAHTPVQHHPSAETMPPTSPVISAETSHREEGEIQADMPKTDLAPSTPIPFRGKTESQPLATHPDVLPNVREPSSIASQTHSPDTAPASAINSNGNHTPVRRAPVNTSTDHAQVSSASPTWPAPPIAVNPAQPADTSEYPEESADVKTGNNAQVQPNIAHPFGASFQSAASPQQIQTEAKAEHSPSQTQTAAKPGVDHGATPKPAGHSESGIGETGATSRSATGDLNMRPAFHATTAQPIAEPEAQTPSTNPVAQPGANRTHTTQNRPTPGIDNAETASVRTPEGQPLRPAFHATTAQPIAEPEAQTPSTNPVAQPSANWTHTTQNRPTPGIDNAATASAHTSEGQHIRQAFHATNAQPIAEPEAQTPSTNLVAQPGANQAHTTQNRPTPGIGNAETASVRTPEGQPLRPAFYATTAQPIAEPETQTPSINPVAQPGANQAHTTQNRPTSVIGNAGTAQTSTGQHIDPTHERPVFGQDTKHPSTDTPVAGFDRTMVRNVAHPTPSESNPGEGRPASSANAQPNPPIQRNAETERDPVPFTASGTVHQTNTPEVETRVWSDNMANQSSATLDRGTSNRTARTVDQPERTPMFSTTDQNHPMPEQTEAAMGLPITDEAPEPITGPPVPDAAMRNNPNAMPPPTMPDMRIDSGAPTRSADASASFQLQDASPEQIERTYRIADQIIRSARAFTRDGATEITLRLDPPELGEVTIRLSNRNQMISGEISVENQKVHDIVQRHMGTLRETLSGQGIQIDQLDVSVDDRSAFDREAARQFAEDQSRSNNQRERPQSESQREMVEPRVRPRADGHVDYMA